MKNAKSYIPFLVLCLLFLVGQSAFAEFKSQKAPDGAEVYFISPEDGETLSGEITVKFGLKGLGVAPAGVNHQHTGHHHLLINMKELPVANKPMPASDNIKHFGGGQTETVLSLPKGTHTLQLIVGDHLHIPHSPPVVSEKITITVR